MINSLWEPLHAAQNFLFLTCPIPPFSCGKEWNKHVRISYVVCKKSKTNMSEYSYQVQKSKKQMSEFSYWVQKSKTCVNFILGAKEQNMWPEFGCKTSFTEELVHRPCWFCFRRSEKSRLLSGSPMYGMCVPSCHNECATSVGLHSTACFSLL